MPKLRQSLPALRYLLLPVSTTSRARRALERACSPPVRPKLLRARPESPRAARTIATDPAGGSRGIRVCAHALIGATRPPRPLPGSRPGARPDANFTACLSPNALDGAAGSPVARSVLAVAARLLPGCGRGLDGARMDLGPNLHPRRPTAARVPSPRSARARSGGRERYPDESLSVPFAAFFFARPAPSPTGAFLLIHRPGACSKPRRFRPRRRDPRGPRAPCSSALSVAGGRTRPSV